MKYIIFESVVVELEEVDRNSYRKHANWMAINETAALHKSRLIQNEFYIFHRKK